MEQPLIVGDRRIEWSIFPSDASRPRTFAAKSTAGLLFVHGLLSDKGGYAVRAETSARELGIVCVTFDLSGHGADSEDVQLATLTPRDHLDDVVAAYDALRGLGPVDPHRIGVCGASYGAYLAALLVGFRPVARLLLRAPAMYSDVDFDMPLAVPRNVRRWAEAPMLEASLGRFAGPVLILESAGDEVIPHVVIERYLAISPDAEHVVIPQATHALTERAWAEQFINEILRFFQSM